VLTTILIFVNMLGLFKQPGVQVDTTPKGVSLQLPAPPSPCDAFVLLVGSERCQGAAACPEAENIRRSRSQRRRCSCMLENIHERPWNRGAAASGP
jgi:hypothetical protein